MKVDFQIVHQITKDNDIEEYLLDLLKNTFDESTTIDESIEEKPKDIEDWSIFSWIEIKYTHQSDENTFITGFSLDTEKNSKELIQEFGDHLNNDDNIKVVFKYSDELMFENHKNYVKDIFELEMKLREVISFIFIDTYKENYYDLLNEMKIAIKPVNKNQKADETYYKSHFENEFFFLLFSDYIHVNDLKDLNQSDLMDMIINSNDYDELKQKIQTRGITKKEYQDFIASIKENLRPIEDLRNCIAHNRSFTDNILENYNQAKDNLNTIVNDFWGRFQNED